MQTNFKYVILHLLFLKRLNECQCGFVRFFSYLSLNLLKYIVLVLFTICLKNTGVSETIYYSTILLYCHPILTYIFCSFPYVGLTNTHTNHLRHFHINIQKNIKLFLIRKPFTAFCQDM